MVGEREKICEIYIINVCGQRGEAGVILKEYSLQNMLFMSHYILHGLSKHQP